MWMKNRILFRAALAFVFAAASCLGEGANGLKDAVVLVIRHAEKTANGRDLSPEGLRHAEAYIQYFAGFRVDSQPLKLESLFAAADGKNSQRCRQTLEPLSRALHLPIDAQFKDKALEELASELKSKPHGRAILICWHHGKIPDLIQALGADPAKLLPGGKWPSEEFSWVIELHYDHEGRLLPDQCRRVEQHLPANR
jgi:hypothetical protein